MESETQAPLPPEYQARLAAYLVMLGADLAMDARTKNVITDMFEYIIQHEQSRADATLQAAITQAEQRGRQQAYTNAIKLTTLYQEQTDNLGARVILSFVASAIKEARNEQ